MVGVRAASTHIGGIRRGILSAFVDRHYRVWESVMSALCVIFVVATIRNDNQPGSVSPLLIAGLVAVFVVEFCIRCWDAPSRVAYARGHWLDIVSCIPLVGGMRLLRLLRLVRLVPAVRRGLEAINDRKVKTRDTLEFLAFAILVIWLVLAFALWDFENGINPHIHSFYDALYYALLSMLTLGNSHVTGPMSPDAQLVIGLLAFIGIGIVSFASSKLTTTWLNADNNERETITELRDLRQEVEKLRVTLLAGGFPGLATRGPNNDGAMRWSDEFGNASEQGRRNDTAVS